MDIITRINWVDILVVIIVFRVSYVALQEGLSHELFPLIGAVGVVTISLHYYNKITGIFTQNMFIVPVEIMRPVIFILLVALTGFIFKLIRALLDKIINVSWHPLIERIGGLVIGVARSFVVASIILIVISLIPLSYLQRSIRNKSLTGMTFLKIGPILYEKTIALVPAFKGDKKASEGEIVSFLSSDKSISGIKAKDK